MMFDTNQTDNDALMSQYIRSRYFSPHSLKQFTNNLMQDQIESSLSIFTIILEALIVTSKI